jgi:replicative DNA helicase
MAAIHEIERAVLALIVQHQRLDLFDRLDAGHFDAVTNRTIFTALRQVAGSGRACDEPSLVAHLERTSKLLDAGGRAGVTALYYHDTALLANLDAYVADLNAARLRSELSAALTRFAREVEAAGGNLLELAEQVEAGVLAVTRRASSALDVGFISSAQMVEEAFNLVDAAHKRGDGLVGADTGLRELNEMLGGWESGTFTVLMGSPGVGKTALWLQSALHLARSQPVALVQLEMTPAKMGIRALANDARVSFRRMRRGEELSHRQVERLSGSLGSISARKLFIAPNHLSEWAELRSWFRRMHLDHGAGSLWLDNIKIVGMKGMKDLDRFQAITRGMKLLSRELNVPVVAIHHMHRLEEGARPTLTSGYGSSSIEQDADNVIALWRPNEEDAPDEVEILPLKTRDDRSRPVTIRWIGDEQRYETLAPTAAPPHLYA